MLCSKLPVGLAAVLLFLSGCSGCEGPTEPSAPAVPEVDRSPAPLPEGASALLHVGGGTTTLEELRQSVTSPLLRALVPPTPAEALTRAFPELEPVASHVADGSPLVLVALGDGQDAKRVIAARVSREDSAELPLGVGVVVTAGGPRGGLWVAGEPGADETAIALLDDVLVVGPDRQSVEAAAGYLAFTALAEEVPDGLELTLVPGTLAGSGRRAADRWVDETSRNSLRSARAERARHDSEPTFGDPEAVVERLSSSAGDWAAYLPDLGEAHITASTTPLGLELHGRVVVTPGSPLAEALGEARVGEPFGLTALPEGTALAWGVREGSAVPSVEAWLAMAGDRVDEPERAALTAAAQALSGTTASSDTLGDGSAGGNIIAFGADGASPWLLHATRGGATIDEAVLLAAARVGWLMTLGATALGCEEPGRSAFGGAAPARQLPLCATGGPVLHVVQGEGARVVAVADADADAALALTRALEGGRGGVTTDPDAARAMAALGDQVITAGLLEPTRLLPALSLFALPPVRAAARSLESRTTSAPTVWAISRGEGVLELRIIVTPGGLDALVEVITPFMTPG